MKKLWALLAKVWWVWPVLAAIVTYVIIMVLAGGRSVWFDESYSIALAQQPLGELLALTGVDAHPPLYYLLVKAWGELWGWGEFALRSLSALFASGAVIGGFLLIRKLFSLKTALIALPFLVFAPFLLRYGYELRMYSLVSLIGVLATLTLAYATKAKTVLPWIIYGALVALGMYTLYLAIVIWIAHAVYLLWETVRARRPLFKEKYVYAFIGAVILFLPYLPTVIYQLTHSALPGIGSEVTLTVIGGTLSMLMAYTPDWQQTAILSVGLIALLILSISAGTTAYLKASKAGKQNLRLLFIMAGVPFLLFMLISIPQGAFVYRYMSHVGIYVYLLVGVLAAFHWQYRKRTQGIIYVSLAALILASGILTLATTGNFIFERLQLPQGQQVRSVVDCDNAVVVADDPYTYIDAQYYFKDDCDYSFYAVDEVQKQGGYAMLAGSGARITGSEMIDAPKLYHLRWAGQAAKFTPGQDYELATTFQFDKQVVDAYVRIDE